MTDSNNDGLAQQIGTCITIKAAIKDISWNTSPLMKFLRSTETLEYLNIRKLNNCSQLLKFSVQCLRNRSVLTSINVSNK
jgi:hypothetical protein